MCLKPFRAGSMEFGCGQCMPCRINRQRLWQSRLMLESKIHASSVFVTLTYDQEHLPTDGSLVPRHLQLWLKRVRRLYNPYKLRFFAVGEYGDHTHRPHYHVVLFGAHDGEALYKSWPHGFIHVGEVNPDSMRYCAKYSLKRMTQPNDVRLSGRYPEFTRMSLKPGIGGDALAQISDFFTTEVGCTTLLNAGDVPASYRCSGALFPLGRYLRGRLRISVGWDSKIPVDEYRKLQNQAYCELVTDKNWIKTLKTKRQSSANKANWRAALVSGRKEL